MARCAEATWYVSVRAHRCSSWVARTPGTDNSVSRTGSNPTLRGVPATSTSHALLPGPLLPRSSTPTTGLHLPYPVSTLLLPLQFTLCPNPCSSSRPHEPSLLPVLSSKQKVVAQCESKVKRQPQGWGAVVPDSPSMRIRRTSRRVGAVDPRAQMEKRKVLMGSAALY